MHLAGSARADLENAVFRIGHAHAALILHHSARVLPDLVVTRRLTIF